MPGGWGDVPEPEQEALAATFGALLHDCRIDRNLTVARLARLSGTSASHLYNLEAGRRRPRPSLIASLARAFEPDDWEGLAAQLEDAAGPSLRPDTTPGRRRRARREREALKALGNFEAAAAQLQERLVKLRATHERRKQLAAQPVVAPHEPWPPVQPLDPVAPEPRLAELPNVLPSLDPDELLLTPEELWQKRTGRSPYGDQRVTNSPLISSDD